MKKLLLYCLLTFFSFSSVCKSIPHYYCTVADEKYFYLLKNLIGSIHHNDVDNLEEIAVFDLGFNTEQKKELLRMEKVKVYSVEMVNPDLLTPFETSHVPRCCDVEVLNSSKPVNHGRITRGYFAWKPVIIKQALELFSYFLYLDSGMTVLKPLDDLFNYIQKKGYFFISSAMCYPAGAKPLSFFNIANRCTKKVLDDIVSKMDIDTQQRILDENAVELAGGIQGISRNNSIIVNEYVMPMYEHAHDLSYFADDGSAPFGYGEARHDQILFSIYAYKLNLTIFSPGWCILDAENNTKIHVNGDRSFCTDTSIYSSHRDIYYKGGHTRYIRYKE